MNRILVFFAVALVLFNVSFINASGDHEATFAKAEDIIMQKISCDDLTENQLEILGDYYMEQMHPGEAHERMDEMMGGEGSDSLREMHINMGQAFYCGEHDEMGSGMMDTMMGRGGMMSGFGNTAYGYNNKYNAIGWIFWILIIIVLILLIVWLAKQLTQKEKRRERRHRRK